MVSGRQLRFGLLALIAVLASLLPAATASAHQKVTVEEGGGFSDKGTHLVIHGDDRNDLVTVTYDPAKDEFLIGHDIEDPIPAGCYRDSIEPFHILHCPASLFPSGRVYIYTGTGNDKVVTSMRLGDLVKAALGPGEDSFEGGDEDDEVDGEDENDQASTGGGTDKVNGGPGKDKAGLGPGNDSAKLGPGQDKGSGGEGADSFYGGPGVDHIFGGPDEDWLYGGPGGDFLFGGPDDDHCVGGPGKEHVVSCEIGYQY